MARRKTIDVGLIGCSKRGLWYGALFDDVDPNAYAAIDPATYHHMTYYGHVELQTERCEGFRVAKVYDADACAAERFAAAFRRPPEICERLEDVSGGVDLVFVANESGDGSDHRRLARPGLSKGVPTFIDRPLAASVKDAKGMLALAEKHGVPLLSCSHLRMLPHVHRFKSRFAEIGPIQMGVVKGCGSAPAQVCDAVELALTLFDDEFPRGVASVRSMGAQPFEVMLLHYGRARGERTLNVLAVNGPFGGGTRTYFAKAVSHGNTVDSPPFDLFVQSEGGLGVLDAVKRMVRTGKPPLTHADFIAPVAILEAARAAHNQPEPVKVRGMPIAELRKLGDT